MEFKVKPLNRERHKYKAGQKIEIEQLQFMMGDPWVKATIVRPVDVASGCYEIEYENKLHSIVHEYRIREAEAAG